LFILSSGSWWEAYPCQRSLYDEAKRRSLTYEAFDTCPFRKPCEGRAMRYYCPKCWCDFGDDVTCCPYCGTNIAEFLQGKDYAEKLIIALGHPEPETPIRAAWALGELGDERAVEPLISLIERTQDVYTASAAVKVLARLGTAQARRFLRGIASTHPAAMVRDTATQALVNLAGRGKTRRKPI